MSDLKDTGAFEKERELAIEALNNCDAFVVMVDRDREGLRVSRECFHAGHTVSTIVSGFEMQKARILHHWCSNSVNMKGRE